MKGNCSGNLMSTAAFQFFDELNDFLPDNRKDVRFVIPFKEHETAKHMIESLGIPHTEVDVILVNGESVTFDRKFSRNDVINVYPTSSGMKTLDVIPLKPMNPTEIRFVLDCHLGKLAAKLRLLGFDSLYRNDYSDLELAEISVRDDRILLTRDRGLLKRSIVIRGYFIRNIEPKLQLVDVINRFGLVDQANPFSRCVRCNGLLKSVGKDDVFDLLEPKTKLFYDKFQQCDDCHHVYWKGSHFRKLENWISDILGYDKNCNLLE